MDYNCNNCSNSSPRGKDYDGTPNGWVWNKSYGTGRKVFCSNKCLDEYNSRNSSSKDTQSHRENNSEEAKAKAAEAKSQEKTAKWDTYAKLGTAAFTAVGSTGKEVKETTDYLSKMIFSNDPEEVANQLSEICSIWGGAEKYILADTKTAVKKAAFEKFEYGLMKLQQVGSPSQIEFFTKKQKEMKPKKFFGLF